MQIHTFNINMYCVEMSLPSPPPPSVLVSTSNNSSQRHLQTYQSALQKYPCCWVEMPQAAYSLGQMPDWDMMMMMMIQPNAQLVNQLASFVLFFCKFFLFVF